MTITALSTKNEMINDIKDKIALKIFEPETGNFIINLINKAESLDEAFNVYQLGTNYTKTGLHYEVKKEKLSDTIRYLSKNEALSFKNDDSGQINKLVIGDNYPALQNLLIEYKGLIDVIYIDPPYGKDSMGEFAKTNYQNALTRDNLLSMLYPRLCLAKKLLTKTGTIFVSIDDKNQAYVKCLMDEVFGENHFVTSIPRITKAQRAGQETYMDVSHDYIVVYSTAEDFENIIDREYDDSDVKVDSIGHYIPGDTKAILAAVSQGYSAGGDYDFEYNGTIYKPVTREGIRNRWLWKKERMEAAAKLGILVETSNSLRMQIYLDKKFDENTNEMVDKDPNLIFHTSDFVDSENSKYSNANGVNNLEAVIPGKKFDNPKPVLLIQKLIQFCQNKDAIVLDFFAGSGTTGQAVLELNRLDSGNRIFILCTNNEITEKTPNGIAIDVTSKRMKRIMTGKCYDNTRDFKWLDDHAPYGGNLEVLNISEVSNKETTKGKSAFEVIDETLYGLPKFKNIKEKIEWVINNFENTQLKLED